MHNQRWHILQWTPFPGVYEPLPAWQLQAAEWALQMNRRTYYERAIRIGGELAYTLADARRIVAYWQKRYTFAEFQISRAD